MFIAKQLQKMHLINQIKMYRTELEMNILNIQNNANEIIKQLKSELLLERNKQEELRLQNFKAMDEKYKLQENKFNESVRNVKEREEIWEKERSEILGEVQNLKADALEMVTKMALEYEDEVAGAEKRRSLSQEAFCLQIIVSMKTDEMRNLREQVAITEQKLEQSENSKKKLSLVLARIEDLKEQIRIKDEAQR